MSELEAALAAEVRDHEPKGGPAFATIVARHRRRRRGHQLLAGLAAAAAAAAAVSMSPLAPWKQLPAAPDKLVTAESSPPAAGSDFPAAASHYQLEYRDQAQYQAERDEALLASCLALPGYIDRVQTASPVPIITLYHLGVEQERSAFMACLEGLRDVEVRAFRDTSCGLVAYGVRVSSPRAEQYLGLTARAARELAARSGHQVRVVGQDGNCSNYEVDPGQGRVSVYLENGRVQEARFL